MLAVCQPGDAGVAHVVANQVGWAAAAGWSCVVACDPETRVADLTQRLGGRVAPWPARRSPASGLVREVATLRQIVAQTDPDLVHLHSSKAGLVGRLAIRGRRPTLFQPHAWSFEAVDGVQRPLAAAWERSAQRWTDTTVCVSMAERDRGRRAGLSGRSEVLPNAVDLRHFRPLQSREHDRRALRSHLGVDPDRPLAVCLGRVCPQKGQDRLLTAWRWVSRLRPEAALALVGDGADRERLLAHAPAGVLSVGWVEDPLRWLQVADVVVVPSRWEGQALVVLEAMASGTAVVASDIPANAEILPAGAGCLVDADDPVVLARALAQRLPARGATPAPTEGRAGRAYVEQHHHPDRVAEQLVRLYDAVAAHGSPTRHRRREWCR